MAKRCLVGGSRHLKVSQPGHLFFGINGPATPVCSGSFAVKVHFASGSGLPAAAGGNGLTSAPSTTSSTPASASSNTTAPAQDIKSKLASAAQVFLAGQFGAGAAPANSSASTLSSDAVPANSATPATPAVALNISTAALDAGLRKNIDALPRRVNDQFNNQGDMVNFVLVGSQQQVQSALTAANWHVADIDNKEAVMKAVLRDLPEAGLSGDADEPALSFWPQTGFRLRTGAGLFCCRQPSPLPHLESTS